LRQRPISAGKHLAGHVLSAEARNFWIGRTQMMPKIFQVFVRLQLWLNCHSAGNFFRLSLNLPFKLRRTLSVNIFDLELITV